MDYVFSRHSLKQMKHRNISKETELNILNNPDEIKIENGKKIYQAVIKTEGKNYLVIIFINFQNRPYKNITVYKTSNIKKYYEGKI